MDHPLYAEIVGVAAAAASLYAANSRTIIPLRIAAIVANALAMAYSSMHGTYPTFVLNAVLLPLNAWRLHGMLKLIRDIDAAAKSDLNAEWLLPYMRPKTFKAGDVMMKRGEYAHGAFYVTSGEVELVEIGKTVGAGHIARRNRTVRARRPAHRDRTLQDRRAGGPHRLRPVQATVFPESGIRFPAASPDRRAFAGEQGAAADRRGDVSKSSS